LGPIYTVDQVLAGWHRRPDRWVGRTILVLAQSYSSCEASVAPYSDPTVPCVAPGPGEQQGVPDTMLYDPRTRAEIPTVFNPQSFNDLTDPVMSSSFSHIGVVEITPLAILRVKLFTRRDCGPLGKDVHPCLLGFGPQIVGR
jgi:hypothetical protein